MFRGDPPDLHIIPVPLDFSYKLATKVLIGLYEMMMIAVSKLYVWQLTKLEKNRGYLNEPAGSNMSSIL